MNFMKDNSANQLSLSLFDEPEITTQTLAEVITMPDGEVAIYRNFFNRIESDQIFQALLSKIKWRQDKMKLYGKEYELPRLTAWYGDDGKSYTFSGIPMNPDAWTHTLLSVKSRIEEVTQAKFNSVLLNLYRTERDGVSWHSDDEPELGKNPMIASVSFGETRRFQLRHKLDKSLDKVEITLTHGSLLIMKGSTQHLWQHQIPKTAKSLQERINLTFRIIN